MGLGLSSISANNQTQGQLHGDRNTVVDMCLDAMQNLDAMLICNYKSDDTERR